MKKNRSARQPRTRTRLSDSEKQAIHNRFNAIRDEWCLTLETDPLDWQHLFDLHWEMLQLEYQHPWVKKAVA